MTRLTRGLNAQKYYFYPTVLHDLISEYSETEMPLLLGHPYELWYLNSDIETLVYKYNYYLLNWSFKKIFFDFEDLTKFVTKTSTSEGAKMDDGGIKLTVWNINGVRCETRNQLDNKDINDFEPGAIDVFESKENLGNCFHFELPDKV